MTRSELLEIAFNIDELQKKFKIKVIEYTYKNHILTIWIDEIRKVIIEIGGLKDE